MDENREWSVAKFRERRSQIEAADEVAKGAFAIILATYWRAFLAKYESPAAFGRLPRDEQMQHYAGWLGICEKFESMGDHEKLVPAELMTLYLAAIINNDREFEAEAAGFLEQHARAGWQMLPVEMPPARAKSGFMRRELLFLPILAFVIVSFVVAISAWSNAGSGAGLRAAGASVLAIVAGGGLKAALWWGHPLQKASGVVIAAGLMALVWWLSLGFSAQVFGQHFSGTLWAVVGFSVVFVFTTKELAS
jgi:hypothetical protein